MRTASLPSADFRGFAPDLDTRTPGVFVDCDGIIPTVRGFKPQNSLQTVFNQALPTDCRGAYYAVYPDGKTALFAGTRYELYQANRSAWELRGTVDATQQTDADWSFAQFGNYNVAVNGAAVLYLKPGESKYIDIPDDPPRAYLAETVGLILMLAAPSNQPDQWWSCELANIEKWQPEPGGTAAFGRLLSTPGPITALRRISQNQIALYKRHSTYMGQFVGYPQIWEMTLQSSEAGALGPKAVTIVNDAHFIVGDGCFYVADGGGPPQRLESPLQNWFFNIDLNPRFSRNLIAWWDRVMDIVYVHYSPNSIGTGARTKWIAWHRKTDRWTRGSMDVAAVAYFDQDAGGIIWDNFGNAVSQWQDNVDETWNSQDFIGTSIYSSIIIKPDDKPYKFSGPPLKGFIKTGDFGDDSMYSFLRRVRLKFQAFPQQLVTLQLYRKDAWGAAERMGAYGTLQKDGWINLRQSSRVHSGRIDTNGPFELVGMEYDAVPAGVR
jgi:hypothetical protein